MRKIPSVFMRNYDTDRLCRDEVVPGCEWVLSGEGRATVKFDGTCCLVVGGRLYRRYELKPGKTPPAGFLPAQDPDPVTEEVPGWVPVGDGPEDVWHREAFIIDGDVADGTYELVGPKVQGNPHRFSEHHLMAHGGIEIPCLDRSFDSLKRFLTERVIEGVVFWHEDGRRAKVKRKDFGLPWPGRGP